MTTIKTDDLTPAQINMLVAVAEGWVPPGDPLVTEYQRRWQERNLDGRRWPRVMWLDNRDLTEASWAQTPYNYCGVWTHAGQIIERERLSLLRNQYAEPHQAWESEHWSAVGRRQGSGPTPQIAAMRAYVACRYGDVILTTDKPWLLEVAAS